MEMLIQISSLVLLDLIIPPALSLDIANCQSEVAERATLSASSSYDPLNVGPAQARLNQDEAGGAWCPEHPVGPEVGDQWLGLNMTETWVVSSIRSQGRYAGGQGQEYAMAYRVLYWRQGMPRFKEYRDSIGRNILPGNSDTFSLATNILNPPLIASAVRILPYSNHSRTVCLRVGLIGCPFQESLLSYNIPQGMVRGATLELLDISYDGVEDPSNGYLTGGLGQLVDGKYGAENYRAMGENGVVRGYEWVGWKNKSMGPLQMDFTFVNIRKFDSVSIHINNHYSKDIQIFSRAKIYFSNEEGKFGDDRAVDYIYMPDRMVEDARNVTINLHGEHGKFVMIQLFFSDKWMLISEITFTSSDYLTEVMSRKKDQLSRRMTEDRIEYTEETSSVTVSEDPSTVQYSPVQTETPEPSYGSSHAGLVIGILLTVISLLIGAILYVVYQARLRTDKNPPSHHSACLSDKIHAKLASSLDFEDFTLTYKAKMKVYGQVSALDEESNLYTHGQPVTSKQSVMGSDDFSDDYAEPLGVGSVGVSPGQQIYQSINIPPVISHSSLSSPSSLDMAHTFTPRHHQTYQKINKHRQYRTSSQNIYQAVSRSHSKNKLDQYGSSHRLESSKTVRQSQLKIVERLGAGNFGETHLCYYLGSQSSALVVVKSLDTNASYEKRRQFQEEVKLLSLILDRNVAQVIGVNLEDDPWYVVKEYSEQGDLTQFLQNHVAESPSTKLSDIPTLSYGALMYMATQIASGMKCLESFNFVHKDLATRNCQVYSGYHIKISDTGSVRPTYTSHYYSPARLPVRWLSWEAALLSQYSTRSDVWAFGVTLWEILTFARELPYEALSDKEVVENLTDLSETGALPELLGQPYNCPRDVFELMLECWAKHTEDRPDFQEISLFLMRKNLGFNPADCGF